MAKANNREVAAAWGAGKAAEAGHYSTDGKSLYSYNLKIGWLDNEGQRVICRYKVSVTTSKHINMAAKWADKVVTP